MSTKGGIKIKKKFDATKFLYSMKNIIDFYNKFSINTANECGISKPEADILLFLANNPKFDTARDIVEVRGFSKAYVSKAVEPLLDKKLLIIEVNKNDRRYQHLKITEEAIPLINKLQKMQLQCIKKLTNGIDDNEIINFLSIIERFSENTTK